MPTKIKGKKEAREQKQKHVRDAGHRAPHIGRGNAHAHGSEENRAARAKTRLDGSTMAALDYIRGLHFPFTHGRGVRRPDDGVEPTATMSSDYVTTVPLATNNTVGSLVALWGYRVFADINRGYQRVSSFTVPGGTPLTWAAPVATPTYATLAAGAAIYRPCVNAGFRFTHTGAEVSRGGDIIVCYLPPGGVDGLSAPPLTLDSVFASPNCVRYSAQKWLEMTTTGDKIEPKSPHVAWFPALSDAPYLYAQNQLFKSGSAWCSTTNNDSSWDASFVVFGFASAGYSAGSPIVGAVDITGFAEMVWNAEFIPAFGAPQQVYSGKVMPGSDSDVAAALKPLEVAVQKPGSGLGSAFADWTDGMFGRGSDMAKKAGFGFGEHWANMGRRLLREDYSGAGMEVLAAVGSLPAWFGNRHKAALALGVPYLSPLDQLAFTGRRRPAPKTEPPTTDAQFASLLAVAVEEREKLPVDPNDPEGPPIGSMFAGERQVVPGLGWATRAAARLPTEDAFGRRTARGPFQSPERKQADSGRPTRLHTSRDDDDADWCAEPIDLHEVDDAEEQPLDQPSTAGRTAAQAGLRARAAAAAAAAAAHGPRVPANTPDVPDIEEVPSAIARRTASQPPMSRR